MDFDLKGRHALVTGGTRGIGRAIVLALVEQGARVTACYRQETPAAAGLRQELADRGADVTVVPADVSDAGDVAGLVATAVGRYGPLDVLVNNAGVISHLPLAELAPAEWDRVLGTNLTSMYLTTRAALDHFAPTASVVNVTSAVARHGMPDAAHYVASKAGVTGLTRALCKELGPRGIRVNAVASGLVETDQMAAIGDAGRARYAGMTSLRRIGDPAELADAVLFLSSDAARYVTGAVLDVDGGI